MRHDKTYLAGFFFLQSALRGLGNWRRSSYSAISRGFSDNTRFVFQSLESRADVTPTLSSAGGEKSDKFTRCSVGRKNGDTFCHVVPLRMLAQPRLHNSHPDTRRRKKTPHTGSEKEVSLQQLAVINPRQVRRWTHAFPVRPFKNKTTMRSVFPFNFMILPGVEG